MGGHAEAIWRLYTKCAAMHERRAEFAQRLRGSCAEAARCTEAGAQVMHSAGVGEGCSCSPPLMASVGWSSNYTSTLVGGRVVGFTTTHGIHGVVRYTATFGRGRSGRVHLHFALLSGGGFRWFPVRLWRKFVRTKGTF